MSTEDAEAAMLHDLLNESDSDDLGHGDVDISHILGESDNDDVSSAPTIATTAPISALPTVEIVSEDVFKDSTHLLRHRAVTRDSIRQELKDFKPDLDDILKSVDTSDSDDHSTAITSSRQNDTSSPSPGTAQYNQILSDILAESDNESEPIITRMTSDTTSNATPRRSSLKTKPRLSRGSVSFKDDDNNESTSARFETDNVIKEEKDEGNKENMPEMIEPLAVEGAAHGALTPKLHVMETHDVISIAQAQFEEWSGHGNQKITQPLYAARLDIKQQTSASQRILRLQHLETVQKHLEDYRHKIGVPTCMQVHAKFIVVGTSRGVLLFFDHHEAFIKPALDARKHGMCTAMDINDNGTFCAVAYKSGTIILWDVITMQIAKTIEDGSNEVHPIVNVRYLSGNRNSFLTVDNEGTCELFTIRKVLFAYSHDRTCLLQGRGQDKPVLICSQLDANPRWSHPADYFDLVALANESVTLIVGLRPNVQILHKIPRVESAPVGAIPSLCWRPLFSTDRERGKGKADTQRTLAIMSNPVLCIARGKNVQMIQLRVKRKEEIKKQREFPMAFQQIGSVNVQAGNIISMGWLLGQAIICMTDQDEIRVMDPFGQHMRELETCEVKNVGLVFHDFFRHPVTRKLAPCHHNSLQTSGNGLYVLGMHSLLSVKVLSWSERVKLLVEKGQWIEALGLALDFFDGRAKVSIGLPRNREALRGVLEDKVIELVVQYVSLALSPSDYVKTSSNNIDIQQKYADSKLIAGVAMDFCVMIDRLDVLYSRIYNLFSEAKCAGVFLEVLEPYILQQRILFVQPTVLDDMVSHFSIRGLIANVELCLLQLDLSLADTDQLAKLCRKYRLFYAMFRIYANLGDHQTSLNFALHAAVSTQHNDMLSKDEQAELSLSILGSKLFHCVYSNLHGFYYPSQARIQAQHIDAVKAQILAVVFVQESPGTYDDYGAITFPWLHYFLTVSPMELLNLLEYVFDGPDIWTQAPAVEGDNEAENEHKVDEAADLVGGGGNGSDGGEQKKRLRPQGDSYQQERSFGASPTRTNSSLTANPNVARARDSVVNLFGSVSSFFKEGPTEDELRQTSSLSDLPEENDTTFTQEQKTILVPPMVPTVFPSRKAMFQGLITVCGLDTKEKEEEVVVNTKFPFVYTPTNAMIHRLYSFAIIYASILELTPEFTLAAIENLCAEESYLSAGSNVHDVYADRLRRQELIVNLLQKQTFDASAVLALATPAKFYDVCVYVYQTQQDYTNVVDCYLRAAAREDCKIIPRDLFEFVQRFVVSEEEKQVEALKNALLVRLPDLVTSDSENAARLIMTSFPNKTDTIVKGLREFPKLQYEYLRSLIKLSHAEEVTLLEHSRQQHNRDSGLSGPLQELYISLLCRFDPKDVYPYLSDPKNHDYNLDYILKLCREYSIRDATAYLLERFGDTDGALKLILAEIEMKSRALRAYMSENVNKTQFVPITSDAPNSQAPTMVRARSISAATGRPNPEDKHGLTLAIVEKSQSYLDCVAITDVAVALCQRTLDGESLWFGLLDHFIQASREKKREANFASVLGQLKKKPVQASHEDSYYERKEKQKAAVVAANKTPRNIDPKEKIFRLMRDCTLLLIQHVLQAMMGHVPLQMMLNKITTDHANEEFREFRGTIMSMLDTYRYEEHILQTANKLVAADMFQLVAAHKREVGKAYVPRMDACSVCNQSLSVDRFSSILVFICQCGHAFHKACIKKDIDQMSKARLDEEGLCDFCDFSEKYSTLTTDPRKLQQAKEAQIVEGFRQLVSSRKSAALHFPGDDSLLSSRHHDKKNRIYIKMDNNPQFQSFPAANENDMGEEDHENTSAAASSSLIANQRAIRTDLLRTLIKSNRTLQAAEDDYGQFQALTQQHDGHEYSGNHQGINVLQLKPIHQQRDVRSIRTRIPGDLPKAGNFHVLDDILDL